MWLRRVGSLSTTVSSRLRRGFSTAAAGRPEWAMIYKAPLVGSSAPRPSLQLLEPPSASRLQVPFHLVDPRPDPNAYDSDNTRRFHGGFVHAVSGDGLLLLDFVDLGGMDLQAAAHTNLRASRYGVDFGPGEPDFLRFVCNPVSGEMFRLPDAGGTKKVPVWHSHGLLTHSARGYGPPDRYAVAEIRADCCAETLVFAVRRFLSQTGKWDKVLVRLQRPRELQLDRAIRFNHEVVAFAGSGEA